MKRNIQHLARTYLLLNKARLRKLLVAMLPRLIVNSYIAVGLLPFLAVLLLHRDLTDEALPSLHV